MERDESVPSGYEGNIVTTLSAPNLMDLLKLCCNPQPDEIEQYISMTGEDWVVDKVAADLYQKEGIKFVLLEDDEPLVAGGFDYISPGVWQTWMLAKDDVWNVYGKEITRHCRKIMDELLNSHARRIQCWALASRTQACEWYEKGLKMERESTLRQYGVNGEDVAVYVKLREQ